MRFHCLSVCYSCQSGVVNATKRRGTCRENVKRGREKRERERDEVQKGVGMGVEEGEKKERERERSGKITTKK